MVLKAMRVWLADLFVGYYMALDCRIPALRGALHRLIKGFGMEYVWSMCGVSVEYVWGIPFLNAPPPGTFLHR
jgi:hypothetical protein